VAVRDLRAHVGFAAADVDHVRVRGGDGDGADRCDRLRIEDRQPGAAGVGRLPDAAADRAEVEGARLPRHAGHAVDAAAAERSDHAPAQSAVERGIDAPFLSREAPERRADERSGERRDEEYETDRSLSHHETTESDGTT